MGKSDLDKAIKFGAGRYRQDKRLLEECGSEIKRFGKKVYIIAGLKAYEAVKYRLLPSLRRSEVEYVTVIYQGACSYEAAKEHGKKCIAAGCDEVVGIGGGKIMDFAKAAAEFAGVGVVNIPTSISTCAAFTAMSVMYTVEGAYRDSWRFEHEVDAVLVDLTVIANCPYRYAAAGIMDAMAKKIEIQNGMPVMRPEESRFDLYTAFSFSEYISDILEQYGERAIADIQKKQVTEAVEYVAFINIAITGLVANITKSFHQSALAHAIYYGVRTYFSKEAKEALHGEIVAIGLFVQLYYNKLNQEKEKLKDFMHRIHMPLSLNEIGIDNSKKNLALLECYLAVSPYVEPEKEKLSLLHEAVLQLA